MTYHIDPHGPPPPPWAPAPEGDWGGMCGDGGWGITKLRRDIEWKEEKKRKNRRQSPNILDKAPTQAYYIKPQNTEFRLNIMDKDPCKAY